MTKAPWIEWKGGECPVPPDTVVEVKITGRDLPSLGRADSLFWSLSAMNGAIVAYRVMNYDHGGVLPAFDEKTMETLHGSSIGKRLSFQTDAPQRPEPNFSTRITEAEEMAKDAYATLKDACTTFAASSWDEDDCLLSSTFDEVGVRLNRALEAFMVAAALARDYARREV